MAQNRNFKGVWIPRNIWVSRDLTLQEKCFLIEIDSLDNERGCFSGNQYFAEFFQLSKGRVSQVVKSLIIKNYLSVEYVSAEGNKSIVGRILRLKVRVCDIETEVFNKLKTPQNNDVDLFRKLNRGVKETKEGCLGNAIHSNTLLNNTLLNNTLKNSLSGKKNPTVDFKQLYKTINLNNKNSVAKFETELAELKTEVARLKAQTGKQSDLNGLNATNTLTDKADNENPVPNGKTTEKNKRTTETDNVIDYLNKKAETAYRKDTATTLTSVSARLDEYGADVLKAIIDSKCKEWAGTEMQKYLRPSTIFNKTKCENYANGLIQSQNKPAKGKKESFYDSEMVEAAAARMKDRNQRGVLI
jgi:uncharacterized phage protein (TIGR02220 family)